MRKKGVKMIKKITICTCDVCGTIANAKPAGSQYNEIYYSRPDGWTQGASREIDICPECAAKINPKPKMDYGSLAKQVK